MEVVHRDQLFTVSAVTRSRRHKTNLVRNRLKRNFFTPQVWDLWKSLPKDVKCLQGFTWQVHGRVSC